MNTIKSKERTQIRGLYIIGLLAVFLSIVLTRNTLEISFFNFPFDIIPLLKVNIVVWVAYSAFEIVGYSDDLIGKKIAQIFSLYSPMFLLVSFWISGITFIFLLIIVLYERLFWIGSLFGVLFIISIIDFLFSFKDRYQKGFFTDLRNKMYQIDKEILFGSLFLTSSILVAYGPIEYIWLFWIISLIFMLFMIHFRYKKSLKERI